MTEASPRLRGVVEDLLSELERRGETLATAESLTGGLLGELITAVPGASRSYVGGVISYATRLKHELAGVELATLTGCGPVAARTAREMAQGVARRCGATWGMATTGVAGPESVGPHPVGHVFVAVSRATGGAGHVTELNLTGDREAIRTQAAQTVVDLMLATLRS